MHFKVRYEGWLGVNEETKCNMTQVHIPSSASVHSPFTSVATAFYLLLYLHHLLLLQHSIHLNRFHCSACSSKYFILEIHLKMQNCK